MFSSPIIVTALFDWEFNNVCGDDGTCYHGICKREIAEVALDAGEYLRCVGAVERVEGWEWDCEEHARFDELMFFHDGWWAKENMGFNFGICCRLACCFTFLCLFASLRDGLTRMVGILFGGMKPGWRSVWRYVLVIVGWVVRVLRLRKSYLR